MSHNFAGPFLQVLRWQEIGEALGWEDFRHYRRRLDSLRPLLADVEKLHPATGGPNVEYPWEARTASGWVEWQVPAEHRFAVDPRSRAYKDLIGFLRQLLDRLDALAKLRRASR